MAVYLFRCEHCGHRFSREAPVSRGGGWRRRCPQCRRMAERDLRSERAAAHEDIRPFFSEAMGRGWIDEHTPEPGIPGETYDADGRLLVKSGEHLRRLKRALGLREKHSYVE